MKIERALQLSAPALRAAAPGAFKKAGLLYLGDEFCQNLVPSPEDFALALAKFPGRVALVTPLLTDAAFDSVEEIIKAQSSPRRRLEVVVNDLGLLHTLKTRYARRVLVSLGRVFAHRVKVMPRSFAAGFLKKHNVKRVELDDPALLPRFEGLGLKVSFHTPFRYVSVTRFCPWERHWPAGCGYACEGRVKELEHPRLPAPLLLKGQAYGLKTGAPPRHPAIDRLVQEPLPAGRRK
ncbi:MAG: hypothetical protein A2049_09925 [Elusimicrobia bacterium GWA2_62_23]|nr:MAG: hypothetical protein A2049_09925 [Elusimicrobia bacterium GWA2_62_23]OGR67225.1 MAG: hypothetical protein A2179_01775 [Elusimicrobia bacterium GWC2_63_65]